MKTDQVDDSETESNSKESSEDEWMFVDGDSHSKFKHVWFKISGVDRRDQMVSYCWTPRKTIDWYLKVFFHFLYLSLWNVNYL